MTNHSLTQQQVAELSADDISAMSDNDLVEVVQTITHRFDSAERADYFDRGTLTTMAFLARRCCQNELAS